jgi:hypothetical protein
MADAKPKRRWVRFSLRTLLVGMTVLCVWLGFKVNTARRQKEAVDAILKAGGEVRFDYQVVPDPGGNSSLRAYDVTLLPPGPAWLRKLIGDEYFRSVFTVVVLRPADSISTWDFEPLAKLSGLQQLTLQFNESQPPIQRPDLTVLGTLSQLKALLLIGNCSDDSMLSSLNNMPQLRNLALQGERITDKGMQQIEKMIQLKVLTLQSTSISDEGFKHLQNLNNLECLRLDDAKCTDTGLQYLKGLKKLTELSLRATKVTNAGVRELQKSLPKCKIYGP